MKNLLLLVFLVSSGLSALARGAPATVSEQSGFLKTGRIEEINGLCKEFKARYSKWVSCAPLGMSPEGRPLWLFQVGLHRKPGARPVFYFQGGIHSGEIDGKDAGFAFLRDLLEAAKAGKPQGVFAANASRLIFPEAARKILEDLTLLFVPVFNVDGHERFGAHNRPNQVGPQEMGWRTTAQNLNLNRDFMKTDAPEMELLLKSLESWDPLVFADLHVTDGAKFQHDLGVMVEPSLDVLVPGPAGEAAMRLGKSLSDFIQDDLKKVGHLPVPFYPSFKEDDQPLTGFSNSPTSPRFSQGYWSSRNRFGILVETHSWKPYRDRVRSTYDFLISASEFIVKNNVELSKVAHDVDVASTHLEGESTLALAFDTTEKSETIEFQGYKYTREKSALSGAVETIYDDHSPEVWKLPLFAEQKITLQAKTPSAGGGYIVPVQEANWMAQKLKVHGLKYEILSKKGEGEFEVFRANQIEFSKDSFEGHQSAKVKGVWAKEKASFEKGALFVPFQQSRARLVMLLMEPEFKDSYSGWGFFNRYYEQKEYMENYVALQVGLEMMKDPAIKKEFEAKLASDPEFEKNGAKRLEFFYRKHPSWDQNYGRYPILKGRKP